MLFVSCDPGLTGALALLAPGRGLLACADLPTCTNGQATGKMLRWLDIDALEVILGGWATAHDFARDSVHGIIERPIPMPSLPAQTIASQFDTFGGLRAVIGRRAREMSMPNPKAWKSFFGLRDEKTASRECCLRLYPQAPVSLVKHHNRAEAILIGHWAMRTMA